MNPSNSEDADVPVQAVQALAAASQLTLESGATVVLVRDGKLIRIEAGRETVLKTVGETPKVVGSRTRVLNGSRSR